MELSPDKILNNFHNGMLDKESAVEKLIDFIENSNIHHVRADGVNILGKIGLIDEKVFHLLENLMIADSDMRVRIEAAKIINRDYFKIAFKALNWAILHEESLELLKILYDTIIKTIESLVLSNSRSILEESLKNIRTNQFRVNLEKLNEKAEITVFNIEEIAEILLNFYTLLLLKKKFWRLKYKVKDFKIVELDFQFKGLIKIPEEIKNLKYLNKLTLRYNQITFIPDWIGSLTSLEMLDLYSNSLISIPPSIGNLVNLKFFSLSINKLETIPEEICSLSYLEELDLGLNRLKKIPKSIGKLQSLKKMNIFENYLTSLPMSIGNLKNLEYLNMSCNKLVHLPKTLGNLKKLKVLNCEKNRITSIPRSIENLVSLEYLNISKNKIVELPETLILLRSLKEFYFGNNELLYIPEFLEKFGEKGTQLYPNFS